MATKVRQQQIEELLKRAQEIIEDDTMSKQEFLDAFEELMKVLIALKSQLLENFESTKEELLKINKDSVSSKITEIESKVSKALREQENGMNFIRDKVRSLRDGRDADENRIIEEILRRIKPPADGKDVDENKIVQAVLKQIKLPDFEALKKQRGKIGMKKVTSVRSVDLTESVDGATTTFTLPADTLKVLGVWSTQFPITFRDGIDWTFSGRTLTLVTAQVGTPQPGQTLWALVETAFYA